MGSKQLLRPSDENFLSNHERKRLEQMGRHSGVIVQVQFREGRLTAVCSVMILLSNADIRQIALPALGSMLGRLASEAILAGIKSLIRKVGWQAKEPSGSVKITHSTIVLANSERVTNSPVNGAAMGALITLSALQFLLLLAVVLLLVFVLATHRLL